MSNRVFAIGVCVVLVLGVLTKAEAQTVSVDTVCAGATILTGEVTGPADAAGLRVSVNDSIDVRQSPAQIANGRFEIVLGGALTAGDTIVVSGEGYRSIPTEVAECTGTAPGTVVSTTREADSTQPQEPAAVILSNDDRDNLVASAYLGTAFDNFASSEVRSYLNQAAAGPTDTRPIFGFDFEFRMTGDRALPTTPRNSQLWLYGETLHGVRSRDIGCPEDDPPAICADLNSLLPGVGNIPEKAAFIMKNATSFESYMGLRWEFLGINQTSTNAPGDTSANLYLKVQAGLLAVTANADQPLIAASGVGSDAIDNHLWSPSGSWPRMAR